MTRKIKSMYAVAALQKGSATIGIDWCGETACITARNKHKRELGAVRAVQLMLRLLRDGWRFTDYAYNTENPYCAFGLDATLANCGEKTGCLVKWEDGEEWETTEETLRAQVAQFIVYMQFSCVSFSPAQ